MPSTSLATGRVEEHTRQVTDAIAWISDELLIHIEGDDGRTWLNGQTTADLKPLSPTHPVYGLVLSVKGRILSDMLAIEHPEHGLLLAVPRGAWAVLSPHLEHYIIMEDVSLVPREDLKLITVQGGQPEGEGWFPHARLSTSLVPSAGFDRVVRSAEADAVLRGLTARPADEAEIEQRRLLAGRPRFSIDFGDTTYPQEAGLEKHAVSFNKGCYLGQEVICMLESRGQVSRRLVRLSSSSAVGRGDALQNDQGERIGEVTSAITHEGQAVALGLVKRVHAAEGTTLHTAGGADVLVIAPATL